MSTAAQACTRLLERPLVSLAVQASTPGQKQRPCVSTVTQASTPGQNPRPCVSTVSQERTSMSQGPLHVSNVVGTPVLFRAPSSSSVAPPKRTRCVRSTCTTSQCL